MFSKLFHKKTSGGKPGIPQNSKDWPKSWSTTFFKEYPRFEKILLPKNILELKNFSEVLAGRTSSRVFDINKEISLQELSTILYYSAGIKGRPAELADSAQDVKDKTRRFYPSGGARYPLEVYLAIKRVSEIKPGIYHYNIFSHSLEQLLSGENLNDFDKTLSYPWSKDAAVIFIITSVWDRNLIKYGDFGYNIILIEAGHMSQNLHLVGQSLGMKYCPLAGFNNEQMNAVLDIDENDESSLYITAIGK